MNKIQNLYNLLQINIKLEDPFIRILYLKDVWGLDQQTIAECEGVSQSYISRELLKARKIHDENTILELTHNLFSGEEIQYVHMLPREILNDIECIAFITDILKLHPYHPFFQFYETPINLKIAALASLGIQNKHIVALYNKPQSTVSMNIKRQSSIVENIKRDNRYEKIAEYRFKQNALPFTFIKAGGN